MMDDADPGLFENARAFRTPRILQFPGFGHKNHQNNFCLFKISWSRLQQGKRIGSIQGPVRRAKSGLGPHPFIEAWSLDTFYGLLVCKRAFSGANFKLSG